MRCYRYLLLMLFVTAFSGGAYALGGSGELGQSDPAEPVVLGKAAVPLYGPWKFTVGDSPADPATKQPLWAEPEFDDSRWATVDLTPKSAEVNLLIGTTGYVPGWGAQGHPGYSGYGWYRVRVSVHAPPGENLSLAGPGAFDDAYQVFLNGTLLGGFGFEDKGPKIYYPLPMVFPFTQPSLLNHETSQKSDMPGATQVIAFRFWASPTTALQQADAGGFHLAPLIGTSEAISAIHQLAWLVLVRGNLVTVLQGIVFALLAAMAFALFLFNRTDRAYLWMSVGCLLAALVNVEFALAAMAHTFTAPTDLWFGNVFVIPVTRFAWLMLLTAWFRMERARWVFWVAAPLALLKSICIAGANGLIPFAPLTFVPGFLVINDLVYAAFLLLNCWVVYQGVRKLGIEGWLVLPVLVLTWVDWLGTKLPFLHLSQAYSLFGILINLLQIEGFLLALCLCALLLRRWVLSVQSQRQMALDVKQAQEVQQVILPEAMTTHPGLVIESEYRPAREVGGDFYQIIPHATDGSLLIVAGDVAGKGLQAGMLVALLIGAIRMAAEMSDDPLFVLQALNRRLLGRGEAHATCLALRIDADGRVMLANAGHLPPYLNGEAVAMEGAMPLGFFDGAEFSVTRFALEENARLVIASDGLAEAMNMKGELFGFARVEELVRARKSAEEIAGVIQNFGQEDDISIIAVTRRTGVVEMSAA